MYESTLIIAKMQNISHVPDYIKGKKKKYFKLLVDALPGKAKS